jgi:hypothetical protein
MNGDGMYNAVIIADITFFFLSVFLILLSIFASESNARTVSALLLGDLAQRHVGVWICLTLYLNITTSTL